MSIIRSGEVYGDEQPLWIMEFLFRLGEGGFGAPPVGDVTHGIFLGVIWDLAWDFPYAFTVSRATIHIWEQLPRGNPRKSLAGKNVTRIGVPKNKIKRKPLVLTKSNSHMSIPRRT